ncbi:MAG: hypothetical protein M3O88_02580 [Actinomycetota bacterium]|nr:hypothetical protein [Actinomycetota bacterium]
MDRTEFEREAGRLLALSREQGVTLRLVGALAFARRCPGHVHLQETLGREYTDIDFAGYGREADRILSFLSGAGYVDDPQVFVDSEGSRMILENPETRLHLDVFLDKLEFCHTVSWKGRLEIDGETIPLAEMLMQKMQIVRINEKDLIDTIMLLLEHPLTEDDGGINIDRIAKVCAKDWGWWRTLTMNLDKVQQMAASYPQLTDEEQARIAAQVALARARIEAEPKSLGWKLRAKVGDRKKWYREVDDLAPAMEET